MSSIMREDWIEVELGEVLNIERGGSPRPIKEFITNDADGINWIKIGDTKGISKFITKTEQKIKPAGLKHTRMVYPNDFILSNSMSFGRPYIMSTEGAIHDGWLVLRDTYNILNKDFLYYGLSSPIVYSQFSKLATGSTVKNLNIGLVEKVKIILRPLPEQRVISNKIEALFSELDKGIANFKKAQAQLKIYRQAVLKKAFEGELTKDWRAKQTNLPTAEQLLKQIKEEDNLPKGWKWVKISDVSNVVRGGSPRPAGDLKYYDGKIPFLKVRDITKDNGKYLTTFEYTIKEAGLHKTRQIKPNTLLLSNSGATLGVPKICMIDATMNDGIAAFLELDKRSNLYLYYFWFSKTKELRNINMGAAQPNLNTDIIKNYLLPYCSFEEQTQIVQEIESRLSVCDKVEQTIKESILKAEALRQSILKKAFEGNLLNKAEIEQCKNEADYEPASELLKKIKAEKLAKEEALKKTQGKKKIITKNKSKK